MTPSKNVRTGAPDRREPADPAPAMAAPAPAAPADARSAGAGPSRRRLGLVRPFRPEPVATVTRLLTIITAVIIVAPVAYLVYGAFDSGYPGATGAHMTLQWAHDVYATQQYLPALGWSVALAAAAATIATLVGICFAWLVWRVDIPARGVWQGILFCGFVLPPVLATMAWISLLAPGGGLLNVAFQHLTGSQLFNVYSFPGIMLTMSVVFAPLAFLLASSAFSNTDFTEEEAARVHGAGILTTIWRVTLPSVRLSIAVAWLLVFSICAQSFSIVLILGPPSHISTIPELMFEGVNGGTISIGEVTMLSTLLLWPALLGFVWLLLFDRRSVVHRTRARARRGSWSLGRFHKPILALFALYLLLSTILPIAAMILNSFFKYQTADITASLFTLNNYREAFSNPNIIGSLENSVELGIGCATIGVVISFLLAYEQVIHRDSLLGRVIEVITALPLALPRLGLSLGFLWVTSSIPALHQASGTLLVIGVTIVVANIGLGTRTLAAEFSQIPKSLDEAGQLCGAPRVVRQLRLTAPMLGRAMVNVWRTYLVLALLEVDLLIFVYLPKTETLSIQTLLSLSQGLTTTAYPLAVMQLVLAGAALGISAVISGLLGRRYRGLA
jgi:iron(III) transport system permease protein